jgi:uncharacterized membrane protein YgcG
MKNLQNGLALFLSGSLLLAGPGGLVYATQTDQSAGEATPAAANQTPEELQQLAAPIALYADALVSQILAGATYPTEIVEADRWMQEHSSLKGQDLANEVDKQTWDASVKALTQFPSVLANMDKNLSWTSALGEAYVNQPQDVMDAVQIMRARAQNAGNLKSNEQVKVETQGQTIVIEPANPEVVYVPAYDPWLVYGAPVVMWPGWYPYSVLYPPGSGISFGWGFAVGFFAGFGWGWHHWGCDWGHRTVIYNHNTYISHSRTFVNRNGFHGGGDFNHGGFHGGGPGPALHPSGGAHAQPGLHSGAFGGVDHGGVVHGYSSRGSSSFGGGFQSGGFHGGGFHGGGGRR